MKSSSVQLPAWRVRQALAALEKGRLRPLPCARWGAASCGLLREEAGLRAGSLELLSTHVNSVHMTGRNYYFVATDLAPDDGLSCDADEEFIGRAAFTLDEVHRLIETNKIPDVRNRGCIWLAHLTILQKRLEQTPAFGGGR